MGVALATRRAKHLALRSNGAPCPVPSQKIFTFLKIGNDGTTRAVPPRHEGRDGQSSPDVRRDAMDAKARRRCALTRTAKACGPGPPTLGSSPARRSRGDGG